MSRSWLIVPLLILYLLNLGGVGFLGPDEPRYASIGRAMAVSHDFITPRLDGLPWFEKPPLVYWMTAAGRFVGLRDEWAARFPLALLSVVFIVFFFNMLEREFSLRVAVYATTILATSAGWLAYSFVSVTDLPMSGLLAAAMMIAMFDTRREVGYAAGALLGLSILAKGFVPLVLFAPLFLIARGKRLTMLAGCALVAAPWYLLCLQNNGSVFWKEFFWRQHFERFFTSSLQHVQPFWFYIPVLLAGLFPWIPLAGVLFRGKTYEDARVRFLSVWLVYALLFFSIARNKLPGYALPLLPALAIVLACGLVKTGSLEKWWLAASALMLVALPVIAAGLPEALLDGIRHVPFVFTPGLPFLLVAPAVFYLAQREKPIVAMVVAGLGVLVGVAYLKHATFPVLDQRVSVREFWRANREQINHACVAENVRREWQYGLNYYAGHPLATCGPGDLPKITVDRGLLALQRRP